jgi:hypothetical protein
MVRSGGQPGNWGSSLGEDRGFSGPLLAQWQSFVLAVLNLRVMLPDFVNTACKI